ncbi:MAG TPA: hypothetical protein VKT73_15115 [Xanthobacteraceae bacterium]|nr:hypothetical protein [Xanthobacteraceae bacterium]
MLAFKDQNGAWKAWNGEPIDEIRYPPNIGELWTDDELAAVGLWRVSTATPPDGYVGAGNQRIEDRSGTPTLVEDWIIAPRRLVQKTVIVDRLQTAGKLNAARAALDAADLYTRERWNARDAIYADDPTALALLQAVGADPNVIMAP